MVETSSLQKVVSILATPLSCGGSDVKKNKEDENMRRIETWTESQVESWFKENLVHLSIQRLLLPCSGELLSQMYQLQLFAPEFFFKSISKNEEVDLKSAAQFSLVLKNLFNKSN